MSSERCPYCTLLFPLDVRPDLGITAYCESLTHWCAAGVDMRICARTIIHFYAVFVPMTAKEHEEDAAFRRMLAWIEDYVFL